jgi:hypothetical protein
MERVKVNISLTLVLYKNCEFHLPALFISTGSVSNADFISNLPALDLVVERNISTPVLGIQIQVMSL